MPTQEEIRTFVMPYVQVGESVMWYPSGFKSDRNGQIAWVFRTSGRNVHLATASMGIREAVRHVNDPKLKLNSDQREMGAWDFTDYAKKHRDEVKSLQDQVSELRRQVTALVTGSHPATPQKPPRKKTERKRNGFEVYRELKQKAIDLGVEVTGRPKIDWLQEQIALKEQSQEQVAVDG